jgi:threonine dehydrogenase-like Zn-dependent dehydrogenase
VKALVFERNLARFAASRLASSFGSGRGAAIGPLRLVDREAPALPATGWARVTPTLSGICGSDLATLDGRTSRYFEDIVSFPFVPGHEVVGLLETAPALETEPEPDMGTEPQHVGPAAADNVGAASPLAPGDRVVIEPVLGCAARGIVPMCAACAEGRIGNCERVAFGHLAPGLQTGYCADTDGGWSEAGFAAHWSQLHRVPDGMRDEDAVLVEPTACATHAVCTAPLEDGAIVAVLGAGTLGLAVVAALTTLAKGGLVASPGTVVVGARYRHQRRLAAELGATAAVEPDQLGRAVRRRSGSLALGAPSTGTNPLTGGAHVVFDCVGSSASIAQCLDMVRPRGTVVLVGMPGKVHVDLASLWHREVSLAGAYAYGAERTRAGKPVRTFELAFDVVAAHSLGRLVSATYPIERFEEALAHAGSAGRRGAVKVAFDFRQGRRAARRSERAGRSATDRPSTGGAR